ncbi:hypothetical protein Y032_0081g1441 [Ancylostoma ceylanicum]|uniref:RecA family profile 1 domain-containing protein n=1 Tax=Ancylostoma ceylanicum TaxID=53326 RepID=A0A016TS28_9BILA|nr:hypothetical protein Y032_0081g1441 [Ancylostoma ceylanicum]
MCSSESAIDAAVALGLPLALRTGLADIDKVLHNDLQYGELSEIVGASGAGKTQLCYNLVAHYLLHTKFSVAWLDSNGSFRAHRLQEYIAGCDGSLDDSVDSFLERVAVTRVTDQMQLIEALELIDDYFEDYCIRLVIIDNTFEMFDERLLGEGVGRSAIMTMILNRIDTLTGAGCTVVTTSSITQEEDERRELMKTWIQHLRGRVLLEDDGGIRIILSLNKDCIAAEMARQPRFFFSVEEYQSTQALQCACLSCSLAPEDSQRQCCFQITRCGLQNIEYS